MRSGSLKEKRQVVLAIWEFEIIRVTCPAALVRQQRVARISSMPVTEPVMREARRNRAPRRQDREQHGDRAGGSFLRISAARDPRNPMYEEAV